MNATDALGWGSSLVLLVTISTQIHKQWATRSTRGVSRWLFVGQACASAGFTAYSALVENWVFTITNGALLLAAFVGIALTLFGQEKSKDADAREDADAHEGALSARRTNVM